MNENRQEDENGIEPGPSSNADATTASDAGLAGGTGAAEGQGSPDPTGTHRSKHEPDNGPDEE